VTLKWAESLVPVWLSGNVITEDSPEILNTVARVGIYQVIAVDKITIVKR
jgi:hypothetical protein